MVNPNDTDNRPVSSISIPDDGIVVHMKKYGFKRLFHTVNNKEKDRYWAPNFLTMDDQDRRNLQAICWSIENYHRALKELCCVELCKMRKEAGQRDHINFFRFGHSSDYKSLINGTTSQSMMLNGRL